MSLKAAVIINPKSHAVATRTSIFKDIDISDDKASVIELNDFDKLPSHIERLMLGGCKLIFIEGGDGTIVAVLTECLAVSNAKNIPLPKFAILAGGSTNLAYKVVGFGPKRKKALKDKIAKHLNATASHTTAQHRLLSVTPSDSPNPIIGFLLSTGSVARAMLYTQNKLHGSRRGVLSIIKAIFQIGFRSRSTLYEDGLPVIRANFFKLSETRDHETSDENSFALFSTFDRLSLGLNPFWNRKDGQMGCTIGKWPIKNIGICLLKLLIRKEGKALETHGLSSQGRSSATFECEGPVVLDGEQLTMPPDNLFKVSVTAPVEFVR